MNEQQGIVLSTAMIDQAIHAIVSAYHHTQVRDLDKAMTQLKSLGLDDATAKFLLQADIA